MVVAFPDLLHSTMVLMGNKTRVDEVQAVDAEKNFYEQHAKYTRFLVFTAGAGMVGKFVVGFYHSMASQYPLSIDTIHHGFAGLGFLATASSMYLKGADRTLLSKKSPLEKLADWLHEKTTPAPKPVPVKY